MRDRLTVSSFINFGLIGGLAPCIFSTLLLQRRQLPVMHYAVIFEV